MNKKAISPLIATVLLIGFAVALAAVVMTWGGGFIRSTTERTETQAGTTLLCATTLNFDVKVECGSNQLIIDNKCSIDIIKLKIKAIDKGGNMVPTIDGPAVAAYDRVSINPPASLSELKEISVIATVMSEGKEITCGDAPREVTVNCAIGIVD